jgi:hypothetical protein
VRYAVLVILVGCSHAPESWPVPQGWKHELIAFPLDFAPQLPHRGVEEIRFPPGFLDQKSPNHWSYAFVWRLDNPAVLDANGLAGELTTYFRGLCVEVDGDKHRFDPNQIAATATPNGGAFDVAVHLFDAFGDASPVDLVGHAGRRPCGDGSLWTLVLAPKSSPITGQLYELAGQAACGQSPQR